MTGHKGGADDHLSRTGKADEPPSGSGRTARKNTESLITASTAATGHADSSAVVFLTVTGQPKSSRGDATTQRGAEANTAASEDLAAKAAAFVGGTGVGSGNDSRTGPCSVSDS